MSRYSLNPDRLFDRRWRAGHPFRPRTGRLRRLLMGVVLVLLCGLIFAYSYFTEPRRVRGMAENYLSQLTGGRVTVENAALSLFEGFRLTGVKVYVDADWEPADGPMPPDSLLFSARTIVMQYDPSLLLRGELRADRIVVEKPQVHLCHDVALNEWNYNRIGRSRRPRPAPTTSAPSKPAPLPEILLRNSRVEVSELRDSRMSVLGYMAIDGQFTPQKSQPNGDDDHRLGFVLQSRGVSDALGPLVSGSVHLRTGRIVAQMKRFEFGLDARTMLPTELVTLWERHNLGGWIDVPVFDYTPASRGRGHKYRIETVLSGGAFSVPPEEWMSRSEVARRDDTRDALRSVRTAFALGGFGAESLAASTVRPPAVVPADWAPDVTVISAPANPADAIAMQLESSPVHFRQVSGRFVFTENGIDVHDLTGRVENNLLEIDGHIEGYRPDAKVALRVASSTSEDLHIPASPRYIWSLPHAVREFYTKTRPQGTCRLQLDISRTTEGGPIEAGGHVELVDASFIFDEFPYPIRQTQGRIELTRNPATGQDWIMLRGIRGRGVEGGPNAERHLAVDGWIGPIGIGAPDPGGLIKIQINDIGTEPALRNAFPGDVREALALFDAPGKGLLPVFRGDAFVEVHKDIGAPGPFKVRVDLDIREADGMLVGFPYPLKKVSGTVRIREGYADIVDVRVPHPTADIRVEGMAAWKMKGKLPPHLADRQTNLKVTIRGLPVDDDLLSALPKESAEWIARTGIGGRIDVDGTLLGGIVGEPYSPDHDLFYDLAIKLHEGRIQPQGSDFVVSNVTGKLHLTPDKLDLLELKGTRGEGTLSAAGQIVFGDDARSMLITSAQNLQLDKDLYSLLPSDAQEAWDEIRPVGTIDGEITYAGLFAESGSDTVSNPTAPAADRVTVVDLNGSPADRATQPTALLLDLPAGDGREAVRRELPLGLRGVLRPRAMSARIRTVPYPLENLSGEVAISPDRVEFRKITATHGKTTLTIDGEGLLWPSATWTLAITAKNLPADAELREALPESLSAMLDSVKAAGTLDLQLDKFVYRSSPTRPTPPGATQPAAGPELDIAGTIALSDVSLDAGVLLEKVNGAIQLAATVRGEKLEALGGNVNIDSMEMAGRKVTAFRGTVAKPADSTDLSLSRMQATVGGGDLAGQITLSQPDEGPAKYTLSLFLRNADVKELAKDNSENLSGLLTASLAMEGSWGKGGVRRGRGDVVVSGKEMYRMPLMLGLMQVTNLSLPISSPFSQGTARYSVEGEKVTFERIELRSNNVVMSGDGTLDFGTKQVRMTFVTDNPGAFKIPFLQDLWRGAQQELLRIQVRGTVEDPTVTNRPLGTFTTTVDEVFKGDKPKKK